MKKTLWTMILSIIMLFSCVSVLSACKEPENPNTPSNGTAGLSYEFVARGAILTDCSEVASGTTSIVIPKTVKNDADGKEYTVFEIADSAFCDAPFTSITLPDTIEKIGKSAFADAKVTSMTLPESLQEIDIGAFEGASLTSLTFEKTTGWHYNEFGTDKTTTPGVPIDHENVPFSLDNPTEAARLLTHVHEGFVYIEAHSGTGAGSTPVVGKQPVNGLAGLALTNK